MNDRENVRAKELADVIEQLPKLANRLAASLGEPRYINDGDDSRFLYDSPGWETYQVLKVVRMVSAFRAALLLLEYGHTVETNVLLRTIADFVSDVVFAQDAIKSGSNTADQQQEFDQFFRDFKDDPKLQQAGAFKIRRADRKKVQAAQGRYLHEQDPHNVRLLAGAIDHVFSGYVHGSYSTIMEMYVGDRKEFDMQGMVGSSRVSESLAALSYYLDMALGVISLVAINLEEPALLQVIVKLQKKRADGAN